MHDENSLLIDVHFDITAILDAGHELDRFAVQARERIGATLEGTNAGLFLSTDFGAHELILTFEVSNHDLAETIARRAVKNSDMDHIRAVVHTEHEVINDCEYAPLRMVS